MTTVGDANIANDKLRDFNKDMGILSSGKYTANQADFNNYVRNGVFGNTLDNSTTIINSVVADIEQYLVDTNQSIIMNDVTNTNDYVTGSIFNEKNRTTTLRDKTSNMINRTRNTFLQNKYQIEYHNFIGSCLQFFTFMILIIACMFALLKQESIPALVAYGVSCTALVLFLLVVVVYIKNNQTRRKDDWNKYYFSAMDNGKGSSCKS